MNDFKAMLDYTKSLKPNYKVTITFEGSEPYEDYIHANSLGHARIIFESWIKAKGYDFSSITVEKL